MKLYLDPGHGGNDPGAQGNGLKEKDVTLDIALQIRTILTSDYENIEIKMSRTSDLTKSLSQRTNEANAWGADFYLAIHINAFNGTAQGYEDYIYNGLSDSSTTAKYRDIIHVEVIKLNQLVDRGKKKANFHVLRESNMPAMLSENGFIDQSHDAALMKQVSWRQKAAQGHANGLAKAFNLKPKTQPSDPSGIMYKVIAGSFKQQENADSRVVFLQLKGIEAFIVSTIISGEMWYRVQAGAFSNRPNAKVRLKEIQAIGITDAFILAEGTNPNLTLTSPTPSPEPTPTGYSIFGPTYLSPEHMNLFVKIMNPSAIELGQYYLTLGEYYGIRGDIAFVQALHETNYFRFTGIVKPEQNNFAGIGTTGPDNPGARFATPKEGVLAHLQHLFAYASTQALPTQYPLVDPRFNLVKRGSAPTWIALNGKWAVPGTTYGQSILSLYGKMVAFAKQNLDTILNEINK
ncbi:N-acetylmuramoyl-L-alanine amidase [Bacillus sp. SORGH_AS 510]|uniref:N-acetylmuramoyl-L-alanine amidase n=1 Tax=Bacillus sp. SORGH_AS_0510 TaxID=3041771 RepID=UPI00277F9966|nr:N-acetylmuramoyl-L-alanine amidase [Bacillus sp. SORGH_AS_0510]MDQ1143231.1 N-acetylmuramoyl-L-alanine amidase [Bacillus sp. SORGH_AS_0510]